MHPSGNHHNIGRALTDSSCKLTLTFIIIVRARLPGLPIHHATCRYVFAQRFRGEPIIVVVVVVVVVVVHYAAYHDPQHAFVAGPGPHDPYDTHMSKRRRLHRESDALWPPEAPLSQPVPPTTYDSAAAAYAAAAHHDPDPATADGALDERAAPTDPATYTLAVGRLPEGSSGHRAGGPRSRGSSLPLFSMPPPAAQVEPPRDPLRHDFRHVGAGGHDAPPLAYPAHVHRTAPTRPNMMARSCSKMRVCTLKLQSLPILENLATQLIHTIAKASFGQIQDMMRGNETEDSQAYMTLKNLFDQTRKVYSRETPFIDAIAIQMFQPAQQEVIRKANIATFVSSILGAHDVSFYHLNEFFMETFVPLGHRLLKWQGAIYLELKTQTYISALMNSDGSPEAMLDELFPNDLDAQILTRHPDAPSLSPSEQDFIDRSKARKSYLLAEPIPDEEFRELPKKYQWNDFVREFASCINKNVDGIMNVPARAQPNFGGPGSKHTKIDAGREATGMPPVMNHGQTGGMDGPPLSGLPPVSNSSTADRRPSSTASTVRQPWTKPEEDALLSGLDQVHGPHWSQILALYGRGGSISEVLKDRTQVQLKDKARNLKLWYLKMGKELPVALRGVTGELRKRGGARARAALGLLHEESEGGADAAGVGAEDGQGDGVEEGKHGGHGARGKGQSGRR
ncbi:Transcription factor TBF1, partial [Teratosphaeria destructans]